MILFFFFLPLDTHHLIYVVTLKTVDRNLCTQTQYKKKHEHDCQFVRQIVLGLEGATELCTDTQHAILHLNALVFGSIRSLHNFCPSFRLFLNLFGDDEFQFARCRHSHNVRFTDEMKDRMTIKKKKNRLLMKTDNICGMCPCNDALRK